MNKSFVRGLKEVFRFENIATTLCAVTAAVVFVLHFTAHGFSEHDLLLAIVLMVGFLAAAVVIERITHLNPIKDSLKKLSDPHSISAFYMNRNTKPSMEEIFAATKEEFFWVGNIGTMMIRNFHVHLSALAKRGCKVRLLMMHPYEEKNVLESKLLTTKNPLLPYFGKLTGNLGYADQLEINLRNLEGWIDELKTSDPHAHANIEVRFYTELVTLVLMFIDPKQPDGGANLELLPHEFSGPQRPSFDIRYADPTSRELFQNLVEKHENLWSNSEPFDKLMSIKKLHSDGGAKVL